ncbi:hypothetical protein U1Q18_003944 [Sarracenia purpurea var. burkii]
MCLRSSPSKVRGKITPRKNFKHGLKGELKIETFRSPGISDPEPAEMSKADDANSGPAGSCWFEAKRES